MKTDPYQWFFPAGVVFGVVGVFFWIAYWAGWMPIYPGLFHSELMIGGFFLTAAAGFLMTAVPRFTGTYTASFIEKLFFLILVLALFAAAFFVKRLFFHVVLLFEIVFLVSFALPRFLKSAFRPAVSFVLAGFGIFSFFVADLIFLAGDFYSISAPWRLFARQLFFYASFYSLVLGIGTQLVPSILGLSRQGIAKLQGPTPLNRPTADKKGTGDFFTYGLFLMASFAVESFFSAFWGKLLRAALVTFVILYYWRIYRRPLAPGLLCWCLWISAWMVLIGGWPLVFDSVRAVHWAHILFVGGLSLMVFSIMTRVTLSHGQHGLVLERRSWGLIGMLGFLMLSLLTRVSAPFVYAYESHLAYAAMMWIFAAVCWSVFFFPKMFKKGI
ncbi:MAG: NnrS family protein [Deltaproteobacteria bacterium]|nr:NnrS family protein [Deltaproteobacteria bacterium]MDZ4224927.1 NnrS family protein [bacterium]